MKMLKQAYNYCFGDFWENVWNVMLIEYYCYLSVFAGQVL